MNNEAKEELHNKAYDKAFTLFKTQFADATLAKDSNSLLDAAFCASQCQQYNQGILWAKQVIEAQPDNPRANEILAWLYFRKTFASDKQSSREEMLETVEALLRLNALGSASPLATKAIMLACEHFMKMEQPPFLTLVRWLKHARPILLDSKAFVKTLPDGNTLELASPREKFHSLNTTVLFTGEYYEACIDACEAALAENLVFHHENHIWITRRKAYSLAVLKRFEEANPIYDELIKAKPVWFMFFEKARIEQQLQHDEDAIKLLAQAMLAPGPTFMKVHVIGTLIALLNKLGNNELSAKHTELHKAIYHEKKWHQPPTYLTIQQTQDETVAEPESVKELANQLRPFWKQNLKPATKPLPGIIMRMNAGNLSGFIKTADGKSYYFALTDWMGKPKLPQPGMEVTFVLTQRFDKKKQAMNEVAIFVNPKPN